MAWPTEPLQGNVYQPRGLSRSTYGSAGQHDTLQPELPVSANLSENFSLAKDFRITEQVRFNLRGEAFNAFNRTLWGGVGGAQTLQDPNFGVWRNQINQPRRMQIAMKLNF